ncbi:hypothetical protein B0H13DRAFT_2045354 [Mycena leptocephala]|nr:hypothetical protein B0H13DRAFT_2045354 [Mycena leptocephala]
MSFNSDIILGALLVGTWANSVLYTVEVIQAAYYYRHFKHDNWMLKLLVSSAIAIDSYQITHWGDLAYLQNQYWASHFGAIGRNIIERITKNKFITLTLFFFITVAAGGAFASGAIVAIFPQYKDRGKVLIPATTWLVAEAVTDISIAFALLMEFRKVKSSFKETRSLLNRLVAQTIQTGTAGATIALAVLVAPGLLYYHGSHSNKQNLRVGGVSQTLKLANLNRRITGKTWSSKGLSSGANRETRGERGNQERSEGGDEYGGSHVHRTAMVHIDTPQEFSRGSFKTNPGQGLPDDSAAVEIENDSASYSSKKKQDLFAA